MRRAALVLLAAASLAACRRELPEVQPAPISNAFALDSGKMIRAIIRDSGLTPIEGRLLARTTDTSTELAFCRSAPCDLAARVVVPMASVRTLEVRETGAPRVGRLGFFVGMLIGLSISQNNDSGSEVNALLMLGGGIAGASLGALAGSPLRGWYPVIPPCTHPHGC